MDISEALFTEITGVAPSAPSDDLIFNRRRHSRVVFGIRGRLMPLSGPTTCGTPAMLRDISRSGVGLLYGEELAMGDEFVLELPRQSGPPVRIHCMVKRSEAGGTGGGNFVIGAAFELVLADANETSTEPSAIGEMQPRVPIAEPTPTPEPAEQKEPWLKIFWKGLSSVTRLDRSDAKIRRRLRESQPKRTNYWKKRFAKHWVESGSAQPPTEKRSSVRAPAPMSIEQQKAVADFWA